jgi:hypothetical protein
LAGHSSARCSDYQAPWAFCFQERLRRRQLSLAALLLLPPAAIIPIKIGFRLLSDNWLFWDESP